MFNSIKKKAPKFAWEPKSLLAWSAYLFGVAIVAALSQMVLQFIAGLAAIGAVFCLIAALVVSLSNLKRKN